jgi:hypothetical protein
MQKTTLEIINETIEHYKNNPRSIDKITSHCKYLNDDGSKCAFSRCCTDEGVKQLHDSNEGHSVIINHLSYLKPEYQGHDVEFWLGIQDLHDVNSYWEIEMVDNVLTERGKDMVGITKERFGG